MGTGTGTVDAFTADGIEYVAQDNGTCIGCAFENEEDDPLRCPDSPACANWERTDERSIIWVRKP